MSEPGSMSAAGTSELPGISELLERARAGVPRAVARLVSLVEDGGPAVAQVAAATAPLTGHARIVGLTGPPGVGKSTITSALVAALRARGDRVAVLAVDPSSPFSGGALLGDRLRMSEHHGDDGVYIRSMSNRGHLGGLALAAPQAVAVLDACGFDVVLVETVGVGQSEVEIAAAADTTVVLLAPGAGDDVQAAKAGVLEIGDVFVVNKADRDGADATVHDLRGMLALGPPRQPGQWRPEVLRIERMPGDATGLEALVAALDAHHDHTGASGERMRRRVSRAAAQVQAIVLAVVRQRLDGGGTGRARDGGLDDAAHRIVSGQIDAYAAAADLMTRLGSRD